MHHPTDRITHTTAFVTPVVEHWLEREIAQWVHPMKDRSDDPSHHDPNEIKMFGNIHGAFRFLFVSILLYSCQVKLLLLFCFLFFCCFLLSHNQTYFFRTEYRRRHSLGTSLCLFLMKPEMDATLQNLLPR